MSGAVEGTRAGAGRKQGRETKMVGGFRRRKEQSKNGKKEKE
jgi:hypothetical protein